MVGIIYPKSLSLHWRRLLKRPWVAAFAAVLFIILLILWPTSHLTAAKAEIFVVQKHAELLSQQFKGRIFPRETRLLTSPSDSTLVTLLVQEGERVHQGQTLATLSSTKLENEWIEMKQAWLDAKQKYDAFTDWQDTRDVQTAKHQKMRAARELKRAKEALASAKRLFALGIVSENEVNDLQTTKDDRQLELETAEKELLLAERKGNGPEKEMAKLAFHLAQQKLDALEAKKKALSLQAPFDGWILWPEIKMEKEQKNHPVLFPQIGNAYKENEPVLAICDASGFNVNFAIDEFQVAKIKPGLLVKVIVPQLQDTPFEGKITQVSAKGEFDSGASAAQFKAVAEIADATLKDFVFRTGLSAHIILEDNPQTLTIPLNAFYEKNKKYFVKLKTNTGIKEQNITIQETTPTEVIVASGLKEGDEIVISHHTSSH